MYLLALLWRPEINVPHTLERFEKSIAELSAVPAVKQVLERQQMSIARCFAEHKEMQHIVWLYSSAMHSKDVRLHL